jgi:hypothetical protein
MVRGNQLDRQWRLLQLVDRPTIYSEPGDGYWTVWHATENVRRRLPLTLGLAELQAPAAEPVPPSSAGC